MTHPNTSDQVTESSMNIIPALPHSDWISQIYHWHRPSCVAEVAVSKDRDRSICTTPSIFFQYLILKNRNWTKTSPLVRDRHIHSTVSRWGPVLLNIKIDRSTQVQSPWSRESDPNRASMDSAPTGNYSWEFSSLKHVRLIRLDEPFTSMNSPPVEITSMGTVVTSTDESTVRLKNLYMDRLNPWLFRFD